MNKLNHYLQGEIPNLSEAWYEIKKRLISSTNCAAILDCDVYKTKYEMFQRKVNQVSTLATNEAILWGLKYEPIAREMCARRHNLSIHETGLKRHRELDYLAATPDGISYVAQPSPDLPKNAIILHEFKCLKSRSITRQIPIEYWIQMQVAMEVWDIDYCLYSENIFYEYADQQEYERDTKQPAHLKGVLPAGSMTYDIKGQKPSKVPIYYALKEHWDYLLRRDRQWWRQVQPTIKSFWLDVLNKQKTQLNLSSSKIKRKQVSFKPEKSLGYDYRDIDWSKLIRAKQLDAHLKNDHILDWLDLYGQDKGYHRDRLTQYSMASFIFKQTHDFKTQIIAFLKTKLDDLQIPYYDVRQYPELERVKDPIMMPYNYHSVAFLNRTKELIQRQSPVIFNGSLLHPEAGIFGFADIIVKVDILKKIFAQTVLTIDVPDNGYVPISLKYATLKLNKKGDQLLSDEKQKFYQLESLILAQALAAVQNKKVTNAYLLSRKLVSNGLNINSNNTEQNLVNLNLDNHPLEATLWSGVNWLKQVQTHGHEWQINNINDFKSGRVPLQLMPNMNNALDYPWHYAKKQIAEAIGELTQVINIGIKQRQRLVAQQIYNLAMITKEALKEAGVPQVDLVWKIIQTNNQNKTKKRTFDRREFLDLSDLKLEQIRPRAEVDFYFDFETVNDLQDDFSKIPLSMGCDMIYLIGCIVVDNRISNPLPQYHCFCVKSLDHAEERNILKEFFDFLNEITNSSKAYLYHWSPAEKTHLDKALKRHLDLPKLDYQLIDLHKIFKEGKVTVNGAYSYGLKKIAKAFYNLDFIETTWMDGLDGAQASVGAWNAVAESKRTGIKISETRTMQSLVDYNKNDCQVLYEMLNFMRKNYL